MFCLLLFCEFYIKSDFNQRKYIFFLCKTLWFILLCDTKLLIPHQVESANYAKKPLASVRSVEQRRIKYEGQLYNSEIVEASSVSNICRLIQQNETVTTTQKCLRVNNFKEKYSLLTQRKDYTQPEMLDLLSMQE